MGEKLPSKSLLRKSEVPLMVGECRDCFAGRVTAVTARIITPLCSVQYKASGTKYLFVTCE